MIKKCKCKHEFQDKVYGKGRRVHTPISEKNKQRGTGRCTVCGKDN